MVTDHSKPKSTEYDANIQQNYHDKNQVHKFVAAWIAGPDDESNGGISVSSHIGAKPVSERIWFRPQS